MKDIVIGGTKYPLFFDVEAIEAVCYEFGDDNINSIAASLMNTGGSMKDVGKALRLARVSAYEGIKAGYRKIGENCPFESLDEFSQKVEKVAEIMTATIAFTEAFAGLFVEPETKKK